MKTNYNGARGIKKIFMVLFMLLISSYSFAHGNGGHASGMSGGHVGATAHATSANSGRSGISAHAGEGDSPQYNRS